MFIIGLSCIVVIADTWYTMLVLTTAVKEATLCT